MDNAAFHQPGDTPEMMQAAQQGADPSQLGPLIGRLDSIVQKQSAVAALLSAGLAKQTGGPGLLGGVQTGLGIGAGLGLAQAGLGFADKLLAPGRASVGSNEDTWRQMQTQAGEMQTPSARAESKIRQSVNDVISNAEGAASAGQKGAVNPVHGTGYWARRGDAIGGAIGAWQDGHSASDALGVKSADAGAGMGQAIADFFTGMGGNLGIGPGLNYDKSRGGAQGSGDSAPKATARELIDRGIIPAPNNARDFPGVDPKTGHPTSTAMQSAMDKLRNSNGAVSFGAKQA